ncbi:hypothetical protein [Microbacterium caowuchunii]|uniref:hypothetical protein n=1 Tax=Microbacterium caowuchunii TaxID=2614638 RepID=UPI00177A7CB0|nr:hypothetical protein [Microbacterium caowuchunii]
MTTEVTERRRIAIVDGAQRHDLLLPLDATLNEALQRIGVHPEVGRDVLMERDGREVSPLLRAEEVADGTVLAVVDLSLRAAPRARRRGPAPGDGPGEAIGAWWAAVGIGVLLCAVSLWAPSAFDPALRLAVAIVAGIGATLTGLFFSARARSARPGGHPAIIAVLLLAFAAGVTAVPAFPAATTTLAVFVGLLTAAVLAGVLRLVARPAALRAEYGTSTALLLTLAIVWAVALLMHLDAGAAAAVTVGLTPVALRVLMASLVDVPPGMFVDYGRYQSTRWSVRQTLPEEITSIGTSDARELVARSTGRLLAGTFILSVAAAASAPLAIPSFDSSDPLVMAGRIALVATTTLALILGARRSSVAFLRWMPRSAAAVLVVVAVLAATRDAGELQITVLAGLCLAVGVAAGFAVIPAGRGANSLFWSKVGDVVEWIAIALSLPAGLLAADAIDTLRGVMNA